MIDIINSDVMEGLKTLPKKSVHSVITSPPYWNLRDYSVEGQIGLEETPEAYVETMVKVFRGVWKVLRNDGTLWLNLGDCYAATPPGNKTVGVSDKSTLHGVRGLSDKYRETLSKSVQTKKNTVVGNLKPKDLVGIPWMVAFALREDGWYLRSAITWSKLNPMPESTMDRCTKSSEMVFLLTKKPRYFYDSIAIREKCSDNSKGNPRFGGNKYGDSDDPKHQTKSGNRYVSSGTRNKRDVWEIATQPFPDAHFATMPEALVEPCIKAGTSEIGCCAKCGNPWVRIVEKIATLRWEQSCTCRDATIPCTVLDPFGGRGTVGKVARDLNRNAILIEINPETIKIARNYLRLNEQLVV